MNSTEFVAEVSSNHNQDLKRCIRFVDVASEIGCSAIKFQMFKVEELFAPEILQKSARHRERKKWELPVSFLPEIAGRCSEKKIKFSCTPFYLKAVDELSPYVDFFKVSSYELLWHELLTACARTGKPVVLSTGMASMSEIQDAVSSLIKAGCQDLTLLHCISSYPVPASECNLAAIDTLGEAMAESDHKVRLRFGWSDHSVNPGVILRAVHRWGAEMVEFHLDLEGMGDEFDTGHCWLPDQIAAVINLVNDGFNADGDGIKSPSPSELTDREWRADPADGLRPLPKIRKQWTENS